MINWTAIQIGLGLKADGIPGKDTYRALFGYMGAPVGTSVTLGIAAAVHFPAYGISDTKARLADFLAQCANETGLFTRFEENLNYSVEGLLKNFSRKRISAADAQHLGRKPGEGPLSQERQQAIANLLYGGEWGRKNLGNTQPNDGWDWRGRGILEVTGRANYDWANRRLGIGLDTNPELAAVPALSLLMACDFYKANGVLAAIDAGETDKARQITNGGSIGLDNVNKLRARALQVIV